jgi:regulator of replication initiation timing
MDKNNEITNNDLAALIKDGFALTAKQTDTKIATLAEMVANGFNDMGERIETMKQDIGSMKQDIGSMKQDIGLLKQGQDRIEMRLNNVVYRTELDAVLERVQILEKQMKIALKNG